MKLTNTSLEILTPLTDPKNILTTPAVDVDRLELDMIKNSIPTFLRSMSENNG